MRKQSKKNLVLDMRLPNGYGSISFLSGNRRKPYIAKAPTTYELIEGIKLSKKENRKVLGTYEDQISALVALYHYHASNNNKDIAYAIEGMFPRGFDLESIVIVSGSKANQIDVIINSENPTFGMTARKVLDEMWDKEKRGELEERTVENYESNNTNLSHFHSIKMNALSISMFEDYFKSNMNISKGTASTYKIFIKKVLTQGIKENTLDKDAISLDTISLMNLYGTESDIEKEVFSETEISRVLKDRGTLVGDILILLLYTGFRIRELLELELAHIDFENQFMIGGKKTSAGKGRIIPIHKDIIDIVWRLHKENNKYLIEKKGMPMKYHHAKYDLECYQKDKKMEHTFHETRHTFISAAHTSGMNELIVKRIIGHRSHDITKDVYTHKHYSELVKEMEKFKLK